MGDEYAKEDHHARTSKTIRRCYQCNKIVYDDEFELFDKHGELLTPQKFSLNKNKNWELMDKCEKVEIETSVGAVGSNKHFIKEGKHITGATKYSDTKSPDETSIGGRQAKKQARQEKAKQQKGARSGHNKKEKAPKDQEEEEVESSSSSESTESSDEVTMKIYSDNMTRHTIARIKCKRCPVDGYKGWNDSKFGKKGRNNPKNVDDS